MQRRELGRAKGGRLRHEMFSKQLSVLAHGALERLKNDTAPAQIFRERIAVHELVVAENKASRGLIETAREIENLCAFLFTQGRGVIKGREIEKSDVGKSPRLIFACRHRQRFELFPCTLLLIAKPRWKRQ